MRKTLAVLVACCLVGSVAPARATAAAACTGPTTILGSSIAPNPLVLDTTGDKDLVVTARVQKNGCAVERVSVDLFAPTSMDTFNLAELGTEAGVTSYELRVPLTPEQLPIAAAGNWTSYFTVWSSTVTSATGPSFSVLRAARVTSRATPEPAKALTDIVVTGRLRRADWAAHRLRGYRHRDVELQWRPATGSYRRVKTVRTSRTGRLTATVVATESGCFRYVFTGSRTTGPVRSKPDCVAVT